MRVRRMLAVTHETTLTGAPMNLLHLLGWITRNTDIEVHTLALSDGPLRHRFEQLGDVTVLNGHGPIGLLGSVQQGLQHLGSRRAWQVAAAARFAPYAHRLRGFDLIYLNSATSAGALRHLPASELVVSHVHELQVALRSWAPGAGRDVFLSRPDLWVAASDAVRTMLVDEFDLAPERVRTHHEFIDTSAVLSRTATLREIERHRREYRIPEEAAIVMGAGTIDWRKGPDLFVQLAVEVRRRTREPVHFVWVGGDLTGLDMTRLRSDLERSGADHVHFVGVKPDPFGWFAIADVFALTSREDPFPLVCLEHAAMRHPIVTYRNGGMPELLEAAGPHAAAGIIDHLDVVTMAERVLWFLDSDTARAAAGRELRDRVLSTHDVEVAAPELMNDIFRVASSR